MILNAYNGWAKGRFEHLKIYIIGPLVLVCGRAVYAGSRADASRVSYSISRGGYPFEKRGVMFNNLALRHTEQ